MGVVRKILNQTHVILIRFNNVDTFSVCLLKYKNNILLEKQEDFDITATETSKEQIPIIVLLQGYGIITKDCDNNKDIIAKVTADNKSFLWTFDYKGHISFVRIEEVDRILQKLKKWQDRVIEIECLANNVDEKTVESRITQISKESFSLRNIIKPAIYSSRLAMLFFQRIKLTVLVLILLILVANTFVSRNLSDLYAQTNAKLTMMQKQHGQISNTEQQKQQAIAGYSKRLAVNAAFACDRIAIVTPDQITLTELYIQPLSKPFESGKELKVYENKIYISGYTSYYSNISEYIANLEKESFIKQLTLTSVAQDSKTALFHFNIHIDL